MKQAKLCSFKKQQNTPKQGSIIHSPCQEVIIPLEFDQSLFKQEVYLKQLCVFMFSDCVELKQLIPQNDSQLQVLQKNVQPLS